MRLGEPQRATLYVGQGTNPVASTSYSATPPSQPKAEVSPGLMERARNAEAPIDTRFNSPQWCPAYELSRYAAKSRKTPTTLMTTDRVSSAKEHSCTLLIDPQAVSLWPSPYVPAVPFRHLAVVIRALAASNTRKVRDRSTERIRYNTTIHLTVVNNAARQLRSSMKAHGEVAVRSAQAFAASTS